MGANERRSRRRRKNQCSYPGCYVKVRQETCPRCHLHLGQAGSIAGEPDDVIRVYRATFAARRPSPWVSGSFYLATFVAVLTAAFAVTRLLPLWVVPPAFLVSLIAVLLVGALQLRHDGRLTEGGFLQLMKATMTRLPALSGRRAQPEPASPFEQNGPDQLI
jgi:hypothetical protein